MRAAFLAGVERLWRDSFSRQIENVGYDLIRPRPDAPVTMGLSYPAASARIGRTERPVVFRTTEAPAP